MKRHLPPLIGLSLLRKTDISINENNLLIIIMGDVNNGAGR